MIQNVAYYGEVLLSKEVMIHLLFALFVFHTCLNLVLCPQDVYMNAVINITWGLWSIHAPPHVCQHRAVLGRRFWLSLFLCVYINAVMYGNKTTGVHHWGASYTEITSSFFTTQNTPWWCDLINQWSGTLSRQAAWSALAHGAMCFTGTPFMKTDWRNKTRLKQI